MCLMSHQFFFRWFSFQSSCRRRQKFAPEKYLRKQTVRRQNMEEKILNEQFDKNIERGYDH